MQLAVGRLLSVALLTAFAGQSASAQCDSACSGSSDAAVSTVSYRHAGPDIVQTAVQAGNFKTLTAALEAAELVELLRTDGPFTVFAPTDEAFSKLPAGTVEQLLKPENKAALRSVLLYHVVKGEVRADAAMQLANAASANGQRLDLTTRRHTLSVDNAKVVKADIDASNGVIHVIDKVLIPADRDLVRTARQAGSFGTLLAAAEAAGLIETLHDKGPFTIFAPTDDAFAKLPAGTLESLIKPENRERLRAILLYHVVPGRVYADQLVATIEEHPEGAAIKTAQGSKASARLVEGHPRIDEARIQITDLEATNGVIHVIDTVIIPD